jgi:ABC-2 type transport system ATP-binding protein
MGSTLSNLIWAISLLEPHPVLLMDKPFDGFDVKQTRGRILPLRHLSARGRSLVLSIHELRNS